MACKWFIYQKTQAYLQNYLADQNNNITLDELREEIQEFANYLFNLLLADVEEVAVVVGDFQQKFYFAKRCCKRISKELHHKKNSNKCNNFDFREKVKNFLFKV